MFLRACSRFARETRIHWCPLQTVPRMIPIEFNGVKYQIQPDTPLHVFLEAFKISKRFCAIEINEEILPKSQFETYIIQKGDRIEVVTLVGGG
jgi:sulfur carrier protein